MQPTSRRGNVAVMIALSLVVLLGFAALVIDLGYGRYVQIQLQNAADAGAHAASAKLDYTDAGLSSARAEAVALAGDNSAAGSSVTLDPNASNAATGDVVLGSYSPSARTFTPTTTAVNVNAVKVRARIPTLATFFANVLGQPSMAVSAETMVYALRGGGAGAVNCFIPLALPKCLIDRYTLNGLQNVTLTLNPAGVDNVGWARPGAYPNSSFITSQISSCQNSGELAVGDSLGLGNGSIAVAYGDIATAVSTSSTRWTTSRWGTEPARNSKSLISAANYGKTYEGVVMVFDGGSSYCSGSGGSFNQMTTVDGFMWGAVYDVWNGSTRTIKMRLDPMTEHQVGTRGGGPNYGVTSVYVPPQIVSTN